MSQDDILHQLDHPVVNARVFFPRPDLGGSRPPDSEDLWAEVEPGVRVGLRYHPADKELPVVLHFHGNGEIASDYDDLADAFHQAGASLLCADYRGYGRSEGRPSVTTLVQDAHPILDEVIRLMRSRGHAGPLVVMGRSLGSAPAIELAATRAKDLAGLILESGFARTVPLLELLGVPVRALGLQDIHGPDNEDKLAEVQLPVLLLHAELDWIVPPWNAERNFRKTASEQKKLVWIPQADHNTIMVLGGYRYWDAVTDFLRSVKRGV